MKDNNVEITLTDLFEIDMLQRIQESFSKMTGIAALITDSNGTPVTKGTAFTDFCSNYTRKSTLGCMRCAQCDKHGAELALKTGASVTYYCHAGLMDFAAPIMAGDKLIGCFIGGQVLTEPPDITKLMQVAAELDIELINYLQAALKVPVIDKNKVETAAEFLYTLTDALSSIAYHKYIMHQANIEIEKVANLKSDFLANMSHEIRTPMNAVIGMAEMALREDLTPAAHEYISQIKSSGKTLLTIINDILDFSKIEAGKMDIIETEYEPTSIINDITNVINTRVDNDCVEFIADINPKLPLKLYGDSIRIKQVITNICNNAAKFTKEGQIVLKIDYKENSDHQITLLISVTDTGIGIKAADKEKLFRSFQQLDTKRNRNIEGTGLGLAISKQLLTLMNGDINVESVYGKGSTFSFYVPQQVLDFSPSVSVKKQEIITYGYIFNPYLRQQLKSDIERLGFPYESLSDLNRRKTLSDLPTGQKTYIFIEHKRFTAKIQQLIADTPNITAVILVNFDTSVKYPLSNIIVGKKPFSVISIAAIFNDEALNLDEQGADTSFDFIAPEAKILIVDDNQINLTVATGLLEPLGMQIDTALSGQEALTKITTASYDMILMDHMMPDLDGVETTHLIRRFHPDYAHIPIIALSANAVSGVKEMFIKEGMNDFVAKPIEIRMMVSVLRKWLPKSKIKHVRATQKTSIAAQNIPYDTTSEQAHTQLIHIKGLDTEYALSLLGTEKLFWNVLKDYYQCINQKAAAIKQYEVNEDFKSYTIDVHALKSSSKQIGAISLSEQAFALEQAGNAHDAKTIHADTDKMLELYRSYHDILKPYFEETAFKASPTDTIATSETILLAFEHMEAAIDELDMDCMEAAAKELESYHYEGDEAKLYKRLCQAVQNLDTEACEAVMEEWKFKLKS